MTITPQNLLLEPISGDNPCGVDLSFSNVVNEIREARRQDDSSLAQGDWEADLKAAQWPRVKELTEDLLSHQSKDLQLAAWYTEAMTRINGFEGLAAGLEVMDSLINDFWEFCYPSYDPEDLEERAGKIEWLNSQMSLAIREIPLTDRASGGYAWLKWEESRATDNLGLKDADAREKAIASGKLSGDLFDKAVRTSGRAYYETQYAEIQAAVLIGATLERHVDERFGSDAPSLKDMRLALRACDELVGKLLVRLGSGDQRRESPVIAAAGAINLSSANEDTAVASVASPAIFSAVARQAVGLIANRRDAIGALRDVAGYFRENEPHSPVALLVERAAHWAEMPLEQWLGAVIKDQSTLGQLRELLGLPEQNPD